MKEIDPYLPINKTAKNVVSKSHEHGPDYFRNSYISSMSPLPIIEYNGNIKNDLTGLKKGKLTVIGKYPKGKSNGSKKLRKTRWVVKCICGRYEVKTSKSLKKESTQHHEPNNHMCHVCAYNDHSKRREKYYRTGINICSICDSRYSDEEKHRC